MKKFLNQVASDEEKKKLVLKTDQDFEILDMIHKLEKQSLSSEDKKLITFIRTQLEDDWRNPIIELLNRLLEKYKTS